LPRNAQTKLGRLHDVLVQNVTGRAENSIRVNGTETSHITNVRMENVKVTFGRWTKYPGGVFDNRPTKVLTPVETCANPAFSLHWVDGVILKNCQAKWETNCPAYLAGQIASEHVTGLKTE